MFVMVMVDTSIFTCYVCIYTIRIATICTCVDDDRLSLRWSPNIDICIMCSVSWKER